MVKSKKLIFYILFIILLSIILFFCLDNFCFAIGEPKFVTKINSAFESIESWILKLSTPAAAVAVGSGGFLKKFSFGDEEKIRNGKKIIKGYLFFYVSIFGIDLIFSAIKSLVS